MEETNEKLPMLMTQEESAKLFTNIVTMKLEGLSAAQQESWWDCFVECLAKDNQSVKDCLMHCVLPACIEGGPTNPACLACILACGAWSWWVIINCAWKCR